MCGIAGAYGVPNASYLVSLMLKGKQHRGQEAAGIVSSHCGRLHEHKGFGLVDEVFGGVDFSTKLPGTSAIGHIRYATTGASDDARNIQPLVALRTRGSKAVAHNGNLTNFAEMRRSLEADGAIFQSSSDTELFLHLMARSKRNTPNGRLQEACERVTGAYSLLVLTPEGILAAVDPLGFRPLSVAKLKENGQLGGGWLFASETVAFDLFAEEIAWQRPLREIMAVFPGMIVHPGTAPEGETTRHCSFEHVYFSRPDSVIFGQSATAVRERLGAALAKASGVRTDVVSAVPDSSNVMAQSYAETLGIPIRSALIRNHYTGRTFITPKQRARELGVRMKLNADRHVVNGKTITVVDDSLVRGTTAKKIVELLRTAGAREVHLRIASPPVIHPCHWGIDTPSRQELIATSMDAAALASYVGADSLAYLSIDDLRAALGDTEGKRHCTTCFTGKMPEQDLLPPQSLVRTTT